MTRELFEVVFWLLVAFVLLFLCGVSLFMVLALRKLVRQQGFRLGTALRRLRSLALVAVRLTPGTDDDAPLLRRILCAQCGFPFTPAGHEWECPDCTAAWREATEMRRELAYPGVWM